MNEIKNIAIIFCVSAVVSAIAVFLVPDGATKKIYSQIISLFMTSVLIAPLFSTDFSGLGPLNDENIVSDDKEEEYSIMLNEYMLDSGEQIVKQQVDTCVKEICRYGFRTEIAFGIDSSGAAALESVIVYIDAKDAAYSRTIKNRVSEITGIIPEVKINDE